MNAQSNAAVAASAQNGKQASIPEELQWRANTYALLGALLAAPPGAELRGRLAGLALPALQEAPGMSGAWQLLRLAAQECSVEALDDEYHALFIGVGCGELVPYASWYLTGFLMDRPLAMLRQQLHALGFERPPEMTEPEDHVAALCEVMAALILSPEVSEATEQQFFNEHLAPWLAAFFGDLQEAASAVFYRAVGRLGSEFMALEQRYLALVV